MTDDFGRLDVPLGHRGIGVPEPLLNQEGSLSPERQPRGEGVPEVVERERPALLVVGEELFTSEPGACEVHPELVGDLLLRWHVDQELVGVAALDERDEQRTQRELDAHATSTTALRPLRSAGHAIPGLVDVHVASIQDDVADAQNGKLSLS